MFKIYAEFAGKQISQEKVWENWMDVEHWNAWDAGVEWSNIEGIFGTGTKGGIKTFGGPQSSFEIIECTLNKSFTTASRLPFCTMYFHHTIEKSEEYGVKIIHEVTMKGPLAYVFLLLIGKNINKTLMNSVTNLGKMSYN